MKLKEVCEVAHRQLFPNEPDETTISLEEFISTGKGEYAYNMWLKARNEKNENGYFDIPSNILVEKVLEVIDSEMDISKLKILKAIPEEKWLQRIGEMNCQCRYVKSDINKYALLCGDDSMADDVRLYYVVGNKIKFPDGVHANKLPIIYASSGDEIEGDIDIDDAIAAVVRTRLIEIYAGKTATENMTNNTNPNV